MFVMYASDQKRKPEVQKKKVCLPIKPTKSKFIERYNNGFFPHQLSFFIELATETFLTLLTFPPQKVFYLRTTLNFCQQTINNKGAEYY